MGQLSDLFFTSFKISFILIGLPLGALFIFGLVLSILQAATQVQDQVLSFFPKIGLCFLLIWFGGNTFVEMISNLLKESFYFASHGL